MHCVGQLLIYFLYIDGTYMGIFKRTRIQILTHTRSYYYQHKVRELVILNRSCEYNAHHLNVNNVTLLARVYVFIFIFNLFKKIFVT